MADRIEEADLARALIDVIETESVILGGEDCVIEMVDMAADSVLSFVVADEAGRQHPFSLHVVDPSKGGHHG